MPVQYKSIISEHNGVRTNAGIFDVSHMGEFLVSGKDALNYLDYLVPNNMKKIKDTGKGLYTQICNKDGGTIDDLIIYRTSEAFLVVVNASNIEKDWKWFNEQKKGFEVQIENHSDKYSLLAVQGPKSITVVSKVLNINLEILQKQEYFSLKKFNDILIARTGYTGEDGFEIFITNPDMTIKLWQNFIKENVMPCGLGARDTLRLEATYPLYGHELDEKTSPLEADLGWCVKLNKENDFIGKESLLKQKQEGPKKKLVCLKINDKAIPRQGHKLYSKDQNEIGMVCSGSYGITVGFPIATGYVKPEYSNVGTELVINIRDKYVSSTVVKKPFYKKKELNT